MTLYLLAVDSLALQVGHGLCDDALQAIGLVLVTPEHSLVHVHQQLGSCRGVESAHQGIDVTDLLVGVGAICAPLSAR